MLLNALISFYMCVEKTL